MNVRTCTLSQYCFPTVLNWKLHFVAQEQQVLTLQYMKQVKNVQFDGPTNFAVHSADIRIFMYSVTSSYTNSSDEHFLAQICCFGGMESKPAALPFHPLTQSDSADTTHSIHM